MNGLKKESLAELGVWFKAKGVPEFSEWIKKGDGGFERPPRDSELAFLYLISQQNDDGSWGSGSNKAYMTSIVLNAFLHHGETPMSADYGKSILSGFYWLCRFGPDSESAYVLHTLASAYIMTEIPALRKAESLLRSKISPEKLDKVERTIYHLTRNPAFEHQDLDRGLHELTEYIKRPDKTHKMNFYLKTLYVFIHQGKAWKEYERNELSDHRKIYLKQSKNGSLPIKGVSSDIEATALNMLPLMVNYRYMPLNIDYRYASKKEQKQELEPEEKPEEVDSLESFDFDDFE